MESLQSPSDYGELVETPGGGVFQHNAVVFVFFPLCAAALFTLGREVTGFTVFMTVVLIFIGIAGPETPMTTMIANFTGRQRKTSGGDSRAKSPRAGLSLDEEHDGDSDNESNESSRTESTVFNSDCDDSSEEYVGILF